jgi:hypothetical protein
MAPNLPTLQQFHERIITDSFPQRLSDDDAFLVFAILHTYVTILSGPIISDAPQCDKIYGTTQHGAADALAALWRGSNDPRGDATHWYWKWNTDRDAYRHLEALSPGEKARMRVLKKRIEQHPYIAQFVLEEDDDDPLA